MQNQRRHEAALLGAVPLGLCMGLEHFARGAFPWRWPAEAPMAFALTWSLWLGLCLLWSVLRSFRARWMLSLLAGLAAALAGLIGRYKMSYRTEPLLFTDLYQLSDAWVSLGRLDLRINWKELLWVCAAFVLAAALCLTRVRARRNRRRALLPLLGLALLLTVPRLCTFERVSGRARSDLASLARREGTVYTALAAENNRQLYPEADEARVRAAYRQLAAETPAAADDGPNILLVLSESLTDQRWLSQYLTLTQSVTPCFDALAQTCLSGRLTVPVVGGGTSETEFEVLTGLESRYAVNPYAMGLPPMSSLASVLRDKGYAAAAIHWYSGVYYNRYRNLRALGFERFFTADTTTRPMETIGRFVSDREHYAAALAEMRRTPERDFLFVLTMQNHGGYGGEPPSEPAPFSNEFSQQTHTQLANYCRLLSESDRALAQLIAGLEAFEEPTLLVLFGDHIPPFGSDVYAELGVDTLAAESRQTPYLIWDSRGSRPERRDLPAWQLGACALTRAGLNDDPFLHYVQALKEPDALYELLSYDALFGGQYAYAEGGLHPETETFRIGGEMVLEGFDAVQIADAVYLRPRLARADQACQLCVNGQLFGTHFVEASAGALSLSCVMTGFGGAEWNRSNTLRYDSAQALLAQSGPLPCRTVSPAEALYRLHARKRGRCEIYRSVRPVASAAVTALTLDGARMECQPVYGLSRPGQYALDGDGYLYLALRRGTADAQNLPVWLAQRNATLWLMDE